MEGILPKKITIHGKLFKVKPFNNPSAYGLMDYEASVIYINFEIHKTARLLLLTFWHEYFHALHYRLGLHQVLSPEMLEILAETQAEMVVEMFY